jgi:hypothetical protein
MEPRFSTHGIDVQWVRRKCNAEADAAANAGLRVRKHDRRILFYDDETITPLRTDAARRLAGRRPPHAHVHICIIN